MQYQEVIKLMNEFGSRRRAFFFALDFEQSEGIFIPEPLAVGAEDTSLSFTIGEVRSPYQPQSGERVELRDIKQEDKTIYAERFRIIYEGLQHGDSFLTNLTLRTPIELSRPDLMAVYAQSKARYKVCVSNSFVCFSPEIFVRISGQTISTYPMKGTIDATKERAEEILLNDYKEHCEHCTIVDLMRNDLSRVATKVRLKRFKYLDKLTTSRGSILQMSSEIVGQLGEDWHSTIGTIIDKLLPAGSISGAPKERTCELIRLAEGRERKYYTGVCGYYDGTSLDSGVMIRYIEEDEGRHYYRSGGGITINSQIDEEYAECLQKIYLPS